LRYRKSNLPAGSTPEEQVVCFFWNLYSLIILIFRSIL
jgi:hypothetical protein